MDTFTESKGEEAGSTEVEKVVSTECRQTGSIALSSNCFISVVLKEVPPIFEEDLFTSFFSLWNLPKQENMNIFQLVLDLIVLIININDYVAKVSFPWVAVPESPTFGVYLDLHLFSFAFICHMIQLPVLSTQAMPSWITDGTSIRGMIFSYPYLFSIPYNKPNCFLTPMRTLRSASFTTQVHNFQGVQEVLGLL